MPTYANIFETSKQELYMKAIGYVRVSTVDQTESGLSLKYQEQKIKAYCEALDINLVETATDAGFSGKSLNRPAIQELIGIIKKKKIDAVVILKLDRLTRSVKDLGFFVELLEKSSIALISVQDSINTTTAAGRLILNVLGSVAQWEAEAVGERTKAALSVKKAAGERVGTIPYGYSLADDGKKLIENPAEQKGLRLMRRLRAKGLSYGKIAKELEKRKVKTKKGGDWQHKTIYNLCQKVAN
ncbi:MAG: recombinase family protein [Chloroflexi bacterium]|nr:MAG: recombinase family protein [Chloroflexota bacterium]